MDRNDGYDRQRGLRFHRGSADSRQDDRRPYGHRQGDSLSAQKQKAMKPKLNTLKRLCGLALGAAIAFGSLPGARGQTQPAAGGSANTNRPTYAEHALGLLKPV